MERLMTPEEVGEYTGLTPKQLGELRWGGKGPIFIRLGRKIRYAPSAVEDWINANQHERTDRPVAASA